MARAARLAAVVAFALAYFSQTLALDACALSCEAARAARGAVVAAPCHHSSSCATQIAQPTPPGSTVTTTVAVVPCVAAMAIERQAVAPAPSPLYHPPQHFSSSPIPLRV
jgi:hypothetical protein